MMPDLGAAFVNAIIVAFVIGGAAALALYFAGSWLFAHLTIGWQ